MSLGEDLKAIAQEGSAELHDATWRQKMTLGVAACMFAFEWGTGNEALIGIIGGNTLQQTHDVVQTAAAAGAVSFTEQTMFGLATSLAIVNFPRVMGAVRERLFSHDSAHTKNTGSSDSTPAIPKRGLSAHADRALGAFALGTSVTTIMRNASQERSFAANAKDVLRDASTIGLGVVAVAGAAALATNAGRAIGLETEANVFVTIISSPITYLGLFGAKAAAKTASNFWRKRRALTGES